MWTVCCCLVWFSNGFSKTKTQVKGHRQSSEPTKVKVNTCSRHKVREKMCEQVTIIWLVLVLSLICWECGTSFFYQSLSSIVKQEQSKCKLLLRLKWKLLHKENMKSHLAQGSLVWRVIILQGTTFLHRNMSYVCLEHKFNQLFAWWGH